MNVSPPATVVIFIIVAVPSEIVTFPALAAGTIIGSGTVSNRDSTGGPGRPVSEGGLGYSCIAEIRMVETLTNGSPRTAFLHFGDVVRIEMKDSRGQSIFGAIEQVVEKYVVVSQ